MRQTFVRGFSQHIQENVKDLTVNFYREKLFLLRVGLVNIITLSVLLAISIIDISLKTRALMHQNCAVFEMMSGRMSLSVK
jgi:hypothetical protein